MMRTTIAVDDTTAEALEAYRAAQDVGVSVNAVVQAALKEFLGNRGYLQSYKPFRITPSPIGGGDPTDSINHDRVVGEAIEKELRDRSR